MLNYSVDGDASLNSSNDHMWKSNHGNFAGCEKSLPPQPPPWADAAKWAACRAVLPANPSVERIAEAIARAHGAYAAALASRAPTTATRSIVPGCSHARSKKWSAGRSSNPN